MGTLVQPENEILDTFDYPAPRSVVAREGSELAATLRAGGWVARAGWRSLDGDSARSVWFVRFEHPGEAVTDD